MIKDELTHKIIGCAMKVHSKLGFGFTEYIYHRALMIEFQKENINYEHEYEMEVLYDENIIIGKKRVDFYVENYVPVELKAIETLLDKNIVQTKNYLKASNVDIGLLINFGAKSLEYRRIFR
jgi:GxxExxY protein